MNLQQLGFTETRKSDGEIVWEYNINDDISLLITSDFKIMRLEKPDDDSIIYPIDNQQKLTYGIVSQFINLYKKLYLPS